MELYTRRTIQQCLNEGWTLLSTNLGRITKSLWWPILLMAIVFGASAPINFTLQRNMAMNNFSLVDTLMLILILVAILCTIVIFDAKTFKLLNEQTTKWCILRTAKFTALMLIVVLAITFIIMTITGSLMFLVASGSINPVIGIVLIVGVGIVMLLTMIVILSPLLYVNVKYMIEPDMKLKQTWKFYKKGWRSLSKIFAFLLLSLLIIFIVQLIVSLPADIVMLATHFSLNGLAFGDPDGLPSNFMLITAITSAISCIITCILRIWFIMSEYYLYASIEAKYRQ